MAVSCLVCACLARSDDLDVGLAGIALTYAVSMVPTLEWFIQFSIDVESRMNMLERLMVGAGRRVCVVVCGAGRGMVPIVPTRPLDPAGVAGVGMGCAFLHPGCSYSRGAGHVSLQCVQQAALDPAGVLREGGFVLLCGPVSVPQEFGELKTEPPAVLDGDAALGAWPTQGVVEFKDVELRYRPDLPLVVKVCCPVAWVGRAVLGCAVAERGLGSGGCAARLPWVGDCSCQSDTCGFVRRHRLLCGRALLVMEASPALRGQSMVFWASMRFGCILPPPLLPSGCPSPSTAARKSVLWVAPALASPGACLG